MSSYQCIRRKTRLVSKLVHFVILGRHISFSMECMIPKCKFSKQMIKKYLVTEYLFITEGVICILRTLQIRYTCMPVFCLFTLGRHGKFTAGVT